MRELRRLNGEPATAVGPLAHIPEPIDIAEFVAEAIPEPPTLIEGMLHQGSKLVMTGGSKSYKTWTLIEMALCVTTGKAWWGRQTTPGKVLFVNFELQPYFFQKRLRDVMEALGITPEQIRGKLRVLNLRGVKFGTALSLINLLKDYAQRTHYALITLDPLYKLYGEWDENSASNMAELMATLDDLGRSTESAIAFGHHFSKGNQAGKDMRDRGSGSGVTTRDVDTIVTMTQHEDEDAYTVECVARNFAPIEKFVVRRQHPLMVVDEEADANALRRPNSAGRPPDHSDLEVLALLDSAPAGLSRAEWVRAMDEQLGMKKTPAYNRIKELLEEGKVVLENGCFVRAPQPSNPVREIIHRERA